jgi:hypothetical protein
MEAIQDWILIPISVTMSGSMRLEYFYSSPTVAYWHLTTSFSMPITVAVSVLRTRLAGKPHKPHFLLTIDGYIVRRSGLVAYHILQSGVNCRLPKTPRSESIE